MMNARSYGLPPIGWPLAGSLLFTALVATVVCSPPVRPLHSWTQIFSLATMYFLTAGAVHALAVWGICRVREETEDAGWRAIWFIVYAAWITVVWLPLIALLTTEHSAWVALVLPVTATFATLLLKWRAMQMAASAEWYSVECLHTGLFASLEPSQSWRVLLAAAGTALAMEGGIALIAASHAWMAGCVLGLAVIYPLERWLDRTGKVEEANHERGWSRISTGNSLIVWLLLVLALLPFMASYGLLSGLLGLPAHAASTATTKAGAKTPAHTRGYTGVILVQPRKPHEIVAPSDAASADATSDPKVILFDGDYWYFKTPAEEPARDTHVTQGSPIKNTIVSSDQDALLMEAHQTLSRPLLLSCCRSLRIDVTNADNRPGSIALEILLRNRGGASKASAVSLGTLVLPTSTASPMPLTRAPVDDKLTYELPRAARNRSFNEIAVRIKPERSRSLAGPRIAIKDFALVR